jgi:ElaB/YqjD/DUF883 family membrane-anchored ribosome-binding protein
MDRENLTNTASDTMESARNLGHEALEKGYDNAREYVNRGMDLADNVADFVQQQPWLALASAFVVGYVAAKALRHLSL